MLHAGNFPTENESHIPAIKASDGTASQSNSGITIVVQGTKITQQETIEAELIEEET